MRQTKTRGGDNAFGITLKTIVTLSDFARALAQESYSGAESAPNLDFGVLTKTEAKEILLTRLKAHGRMGEFQGLDDIGDAQELLNDEFQKAENWVRKNYPYISPTTTN